MPARPRFMFPTKVCIEMKETISGIEKSFVLESLAESGAVLNIGKGAAATSATVLGGTGAVINIMIPQGGGTQLTPGAAARFQAGAVLSIETTFSNFKISFMSNVLRVDGAVLAVSVPESLLKERLNTEIKSAVQSFKIEVFCFVTRDGRELPDTNSVFDELLLLNVEGIVFLTAPGAREECFAEKDSRVYVVIRSALRVLKLYARVKERRVIDGRDSYRCVFEGMQAEDARFLFEAIYGKKFEGR
jgi:hypothetical protein